MKALPSEASFEPLMTLYLTDSTPPAEVEAAKSAGVLAFKLYPAGATTNSDSGVTDINRCLPTLSAMAEVCSQRSYTLHSFLLFQRTKHGALLTQVFFCNKKTDTHTTLGMGHRGLEHIVLSRSPKLAQQCYI